MIWLWIINKILVLNFQFGSCLFRHTMGKDDPLFAIPSALLASLAFCWYPDTTVALYVMWKALQVNKSTNIDDMMMIRLLTIFLYCRFHITSVPMQGIYRKFHISLFSCIALVLQHCSMRPL